MKTNAIVIAFTLVAVLLLVGNVSAAESPHPYANNYQNTWVINQPGADQVRLHFTKMELLYKDTLQLLDKDDNVLKTYTQDGYYGTPINLADYWSESYALDTIKVKLTTDNEGTAYGFRIDQVDPRATEQPTGQDLYESWHDYANNYQSTWTISQPGADQMRLHFTKMQLVYKDKLQLLDKDDTVLKTYTQDGYYGTPINLADYWSESYALDTIKVKLITDNEGTAYGFRIDQVDPRATEQPTGQDLYESWHDYANNYQSTWTISQPGTDQMRLHFTKMQLVYKDKLQLLDKDDTVLKTYTQDGYYGTPINLADYWSESYALDTIKVKLITDNEGTAYGFRIDQVDPRATEQPTGQDLYESWHDYANNYQSTWTISQPGTDQMRLHFTKMQLVYKDKLQLLDKDDTVLKTYTQDGYYGTPINLADYWSESYALDTIKVKLITDNEGTAYGFRIDQVDPRATEQPTGQDLYESWHDYANNYQSTWTISQPGADQMRLHFTKMQLVYKDKLQLLDKDDNVLKTYTQDGYYGTPINLADYWSESYALDTIKVKLITDNEGTAYGFRIDQVDPPLFIRPVANFVANQTSGVTPLTVQFTDRLDWYFPFDLSMEFRGWKCQCDRYEPGTYFHNSQ